MCVDILPAWYICIPCAFSAIRGQKRTPDPLELELLTVVCYVGPGIEPRFFGRTTRASNCWAITPTLWKWKKKSDFIQWVTWELENPMGNVEIQGRNCWFSLRKSLAREVCAWLSALVKKETWVLTCLTSSHEATVSWGPLNMKNI